MNAQVRSNNLDSIKKRFLQLHPVNATSGGVYSFRAGLPLIKFDISSSEMPLFLDGSALRISGRFTARQVLNAAANNELAPADTNFLDGPCGINQCIESVTIYSKRLNSTLERINQYHRLCPSVVTGTMSSNEIETIASNHGLQHQTSALSRPGLNTYDAYGVQGALPANSGRGQYFSLPLYTGMTNSGQDIDLSSSAQGGMVIEILLRSNVGTIFGASANTNQAYYEFSDLVLTCPVYEMGGGAAQQYQQQQNTFSFNSWSSMFQTINSSNSVLAQTPGLGRVSSVLLNSITATDLGDQRFNSSRLGPIAEIQQVRYSKNGALYPLQYRLQTVSQQNNSVAKVQAGVEPSFMIEGVNADIFRNYLEGLRTDGYNKVKSCNQSFNAWSGGSINLPQSAGQTGITPEPNFGTAILYDRYGSGTNFQNVVWSMQLTASGVSQLNTGSGARANNLDGTSATAQAVSIYYLNKNTLVFSGNGIDIVR